MTATASFRGILQKEDGMPSNEYIPASVGGVILEIATTLWCGSWQTLPERRVYGELLTLDDPETRLPAIDRLGFLWE